jgi:hypothetical protein
MSQRPPFPSLMLHGSIKSIHIRYTSAQLPRTTTPLRFIRCVFRERASRFVTFEIILEHDHILVYEGTEMPATALTFFHQSCISCKDLCETRPGILRISAPPRGPPWPPKCAGELRPVGGSGLRATDTAERRRAAFIWDITPRTLVLLTGLCATFT